MQLEFLEKATLGTFIMYANTVELNNRGNGKSDAVANNLFVWNKGCPQMVKIDEISYIFDKDTILPLMGNQHFQFEYPENLVAWQFNREFYCIVNHDKEVGCVGFLFYGVHHPIFVHLNTDESRSFNILEQSLHEEMHLSDNFQGEMLRSLLKRLIIKATRIGKEQTPAYQSFSDEKLNLIRNFCLLLEINYKKEHEVKFYASALNKSPKTICNLFALYGQLSPSKIIYNRIILETKRYLHYTDKSVKEMGYELGFENPEHFSRFFRINTGISISEFRKNF